jgi:hypothetical protein
MEMGKFFVLIMACMVMLGVGVAFAASGGSSSNSPGSTGLVSGSTTGTTASTGVDISGPCDEAEHANDPQCTGGATGATGNGNDDNSVSAGNDDTAADDHGAGNDDTAADDHGTGGDDTAADDNSGHGGETGDDNSGHGGGDDSGHGGGDD